MRMSAERTISRPADEVAEFFFDASNNPKWQNGMVSCEWVSEPPIRVGSTYAQLARFMGRDVRSTFVVTDFEPGRSIRIETIESTFPIQVQRRVEPIDESSSRVTAEITGGPEGGLMKMFSPLMAGRAQKSVDNDYDRLVQLLES
ncbi:MAG TPA: SRPBCC family protein [Acidimicrobiia bacterium]